MTIHERIKQVRQESKLTQVEFAAKLKISGQSVSKLEKGENNPAERTIALICHEFNVSEQWLRTGKGDMYSQSDNFDLNAFCKERGASKLEIEAVKAYFALSDDTRKEIMDNFASIFQTDAADSEKETPLTPEEIEDEVERYRVLLKRERALKLALGYGTQPQKLASGVSSNSGGGEIGSSGNDIA